MTAPLRIAALLSGGGRTLMNLVDRIDDARLNARIDTVVSSRADAAGVERARARGFKVHIAEDGDVSSLLDPDRHDLVCLCGWLRHLHLEPWMEGRVMNIHPSLLPAFGGRGMYGDRVHAAVLESGIPNTGCTVHFVDEEYDHGPVIIQRACMVEPGDTVESLAARVFTIECDVYPEAITLFAEGRLRLDGDRVHVAPPGHEPLA
ncbi:MAG: phosphoribosylglycinamide formyltransferase [Planctomycetota bacterium]|nr:phosphoribosylglycinamide formyltransferase [Planctomycetota bacterium]